MVKRMAFVDGQVRVVGFCHHRRQILSVTGKPNDISIYSLFFRLHPTCSPCRWLNTGADSTPNEFAGQSAYELLGVSETSSFAEIKASFRQLAKETHPDLAQSLSDSSSSHRFVQILAAYEILSDSEKRSHYDRYLLSIRIHVKKQPRQDSMMYRYESNGITMKHMEVVEWLRWYRCAIGEILSEKKVVVGSGYFDILERDFYSAIHAAYYGPIIESMDLLPECFEAEERSMFGNPEVLHLVSGRDLFGMVCIADKVHELSPLYCEKLTSFVYDESEFCLSIKDKGTQMSSAVADARMSNIQAKHTDCETSDAYKDLELHVLGRKVAVAMRIPPRSYYNGILNEDSQDHIYIYLSSHEDQNFSSNRFPRDSFVSVADGSRIPLGKITGLGTKPEEGSCSIYNYSGTKTHVVMKHRTLLVKHMHWFQVGDGVSVCECRCSRAQLPPSKFWLFEPRCGMHDIGGWYVETFGRDKKGRNVPSQRYWDGIDANERFEKRLHPAMYLLALAYRTLDLEDAKRKRQTVRHIVEGRLLRMINWCKKLVY